MSKYHLILICSHCSKVIGTRETSVRENHKKVSHGVCQECLKIHYKDEFSSEELEEILGTY